MRRGRGSARRVPVVSLVVVVVVNIVMVVVVVVVGQEFEVGELMERGSRCVVVRVHVVGCVAVCVPACLGDGNGGYCKTSLVRGGEQIGREINYGRKGIGVRR